MNALLNWLDDRTGIRDLTHAALFEHIPGGSRYRYVWGSTLVFAFTVQVITGVFLWMCYSASGQTAWESVFYIQHDLQGGWLLRGLHHFMAQAMVVLLALHLLQVVVDGAYRAPREVNFWLGLVLMQIVLGLSLTGYLLPWDQKGYWATRVATNLMGIVPLVGPSLQKLVVGGADYGHYTLTRFFALHAGVLPGLLVFFLILHVALFRRHGIHTRLPHRQPDTTFWPDQVLKHAVACLAVLVVVLLLTVWPLLRGGHSGEPPGDYLGAELGAPADPANEYSAARPEWYFLFLFQFLKLFEWKDNSEMGELVGAIIIPGVVMLMLALMPFIGRWKLGHRFNIALLVALLLGVGVLTIQAVRADRKSENYLRAVEHAEADAERALVLARAPRGIPPGGMLSVLREDPKTQGPRLFARYCASCHTHADSAVSPPEPTASDLTGFATRKWLAGLLDPKQIAGPSYFGNTKHKDGEMVGFVNDDLTKDKAELEAIVAALSGEAALPAQTQADAASAKTIERGRELISGDAGCTNCHSFHPESSEESEAMAPDLTGYGSQDWLTGMISNPTHKRYYGDNNDRMPIFAANVEEPENNILSPENLDLLVRWLRGDWYEPAGENGHDSPDE